MERISVVGLGRLGLPLTAVLAARGFKVVGVDIDKKVRESVKNCKPLFHEPGLSAMLESFRAKIAVTNNCQEAVHLTDATIVLVPTPSPYGVFSLEYVGEACTIIGRGLWEKDGYHVVVISSTVNPGDCNGRIRETLEDVSGKKAGKDFGLCYVPEFVALGNVIPGYLNPDFVLIGESDERAGNVVGKIYRQIVGGYSSVPFVHRSLVNAELAKIVLNNYIATKITFANEVAELCERIPGADADQVTTVLGLDSRIGPKYLMGAIAFGGPCFPRDVQVIQRIAAAAGVQFQLAGATYDANEWQFERLVTMIWEIPNVEGIGVLGLAFKPGTDVVTKSVGMKLINHSSIKGKCIAYDPLVKVKQSVASAQQCVDMSHVIVLTTICPEFIDLQFYAGQVVIDCWRMLDEEKVKLDGAEYVAIGRYRER